MCTISFHMGGQHITMDIFLERVFGTIEKYHMLDRARGVIAGVSGGADSVCLLRCLLEWKEQRQPDLQISVVHVEHGVRGSESEEDALFVERLCRSGKVPFYLEHIRMEKIARERGLTPEEAGRYARDKIFHEYKRNLGADVIALAHHAGDQAETVLMNLCRGTGLKGLGGIAPVRDDIVRPLLFESREQIERFLDRTGQGWRTDSTNLQAAYTRNKMRLKVIPYLEREINAGVVQHISSAADMARSAEEFIESEALRRMAGCTVFGWENEETGAALRPEDKVPAGQLPGRAVIDRVKFAREPQIMESFIVRLVLRKMRGGLGLKDISERHIEAVVALAAGQTGKSFDLPGFTVRTDYGKLIISRVPGKPPEQERPPEEVTVDISRGGTFRFGNFVFTVKRIRGCDIPGREEEGIPQKRYTKWLCCDKIYKRISIRTRRPGDYLVIDADGNRQMLNRFMINSRVERRCRDQVPLIADGNHVLWVVGYRIGEDMKVSRGMESVLEITARIPDMETDGGTADGRAYIGSDTRAEGDRSNSGAGGSDQP